MTFFERLDLLPTDAVLENVRNAFILDSDSRKVDLGAGIYRDEAGGEYVLPVVQKVSHLTPLRSVAIFVEHNRFRNLWRPR